MAKAPKSVPKPSAQQPRRAIWILNHATLMPSEVPTLNRLGIEVLTPKLVPSGESYGGTLVTHEYDKGLELGARELELLNKTNFYEDVWSDEIASVINANFELIITSIYRTPLTESLKKFKGTILARVFGVIRDETYDNVLRLQDPKLPDLIRDAGDRFIFGQAYPHLAGIEPDYLRARRATAGVGLPERIWSLRDTWTGGDEPFVLLLMPRINDNPYYTSTYYELKQQYARLPHKMFGRQFSAVNDPAVLPYMTDDQLLRLYQVAPVFAYHSTEPRHIHYSPIEAMAIGTPVLYRGGGMIDFLAGRLLPGRCDTAQEMTDKAAAIIQGDRALTEEVRDSQADVLEYFSPANVTSQWSTVLGRLPASAPAATGMHLAPGHAGAAI